jgi:hypothetical protein
MDAVNFIKEWNRMLKKVGKAPCIESNIRTPEETVSMIEEWSIAHPLKTRQDAFLEQWPNATRDSGGVVNICPNLFDVDISCTDEETERTGLCKSCDDCQREFWMQEVE